MTPKIEQGLKLGSGEGVGRGIWSRNIGFGAQPGAGIWERSGVTPRSLAGVTGGAQGCREESLFKGEWRGPLGEDNLGTLVGCWGKIRCISHGHPGRSQRANVWGEERAKKPQETPRH